MKKQTKINKMKAKNQQKPGQPIQDQRFKRIHYDPKFTPHSNKLNKVKVDNRFQAMLTDPKFSVANSKDKYGRKVPQQQQANAELQQYYYKDEPQEQYQEQQQIDDDYEDSQGQENAQQQQQGDLRKWMEEYDEQSSQQDLNIEELAELGQDKIWSDDQENVIKNQKVPITKRLALCNYDWMSINAKDLMILFNSFKSKNGYIQSVQVYQSLYGKQKMQQQQRYGPQQLLKASEAFHKNNKTNRKKITDLLKQTDDYTKNLNEKQLRAYEKERLKYFYAIITCDNKKTSQQIYDNCDGQQFENSNLSIDLRYVPDDLVIDSEYLKDQCTELPRAGEVKQILSRATGHSKVDLTWENPELSQLAKLKKNNWNKMTDEQIDNIDWGLYLNQGDIEQQDDMKQLEKAVEVQHEITQAGWRSQFNKKKRKRSDDIEITFGSGFQNAGFKKQSKPQLKSLNQQKKASMKERRKLKEQKNKEKLQLLADNEKKIDFKPDLSDNRFKAVYENPLYTIDPVDPKFDHKRAGKVFEETVKRNRNKQTKSWN